MSGRIFILILLLIGIGITTWASVPPKKTTDASRSQPEATPAINPNDLYEGTSYEAIYPNEYDVQIFSKDIKSPTRLKISPDGNRLFVSQLTGELFVFNRENGEWNRSPKLVTRLTTDFPGFPPEEAGLAGFAYSAKFKENGKIFLLYTARDKEGKTQNRIAVTSVSEKNGTIVGTEPKQIFQANVPGSPSHQITDGAGIIISNKPYLMAVLGEGFEGKQAQDPSLEAGKIILLSEDGQNPDVNRPYTENPKVQALGIRNAFVMTKNPYDPSGRWIIADTGPDHFDRLLMTNLADTDVSTPRNFKWNGDEAILKLPIPDPTHREVTDMAILRLPDTRTFTGLEFHRGKGPIPQSTDSKQSVLATLFGKTGFRDNAVGKEIWLGSLTNLKGQPKISFKPIIHRVKETDGKLGNPIGLTVDQQTGNFFFADILEGRIYIVIPKGGE